MNETRSYTASFILDMRGVTESVDEITKRLSGVITDVGGTVSETKNLGQKMFERVANKKFSSGIYVQIMFDGDPTVPEKVKSKLKLDKVINRVMIEAERKLCHLSTK